MYKVLFAVALLSLSAFSISAQVSTGGKDIAVDPSGQVAIIAGNNYVLRSTDGGLTWSPTPTPYAHPERVLIRRDDVQTFIVGKHGEMAYSTTAGTGAWTIALQDSTLVPIRMLQSLIHPNVLILSRAPSLTTTPLWMSGTGGHTWEPNVYFGPRRKTLYDIAVYPVTSDSGHRRWGFLCGEGGEDSIWGDPYDGFWSGIADSSFPFFGWFFTTAIWPVLDMDMKSLVIVPRPYPTDFLRLIVADAPLARDTVFRSSSLSGPDRVPLFWGADTIRMIRARRSDNWIFLATNRGVFRSSDEGDSWQQKSVGIADTNVQAIALPDGGRTVFAVSPTAAYVSNDDGDSWQMAVTGVDASTPPMPSQFALEQNFPNPFNPTTTISYALPTKGVVRLTVHNILGQLVTTLVFRESEPGIHQVGFQATGLTSGVYYYRLQSNATTITKRMLLLK